MHKVIILQARLASSRLPRKVLADISGKPVIAHIVERLKCSELADEICVAIPTDKNEDGLAEIVSNYPVTVVRGSQHDVLRRFIMAANQTRADLIVRTTADNPMVSYEEVDRQLKYLVDNPETDYVITEGYPLGVTTETFTLKTLEKLDYLARHAHMREHVTLYLRENPGPFSVKTLEAPPELTEPDMRLSLDTQQDLELFKAIFNKLYSEDKQLNLKEVINLVKSDPTLASLSRAHLIAKTA